MAPDSERRQTLRSKFLRVTIPLIFLSVIGVFSVIEYVTHRTAAARMEQSMAATIATQSAALANPLWNLDDEQIQLALEAVVSNREILSARVLGEEGEVMSAAGEVPASAVPRDLMPLSRAILFDAGTGPRAIGTLEFVATRQFLQAQTRNRLLLAAAIACLAVAIEVGAALYAMRTIIGRPLAVLLEAINASRSGAKRSPVEWDSTDELGQVIAAFNEMQERQKSDEDALRRARDTLEERVAERTTELAAARDEANQARARLSDGIEAISEGFSLYDRDDRLVIANSRYAEILNITDADLIRPGRSFEDILRAAVERGLIADAPDDAAAFIADRLGRHRDPDGTEQIRLYANDRWVRISERRTRDGGTVVVYSDITELKDRELNLEASRAEAEAANASKSAFLATMSHEVRTPMNGIIGMGRLLADTPLTPEQRDCTETITTAADQLLTIINDILDFSKVEAGAMEIERIAMDLTDVVESAAELVAPRAADKGLELICRIDPGVPSDIVGDPVRIRQILLNLLTNAVKFTETGEVELSVRTVPGAAGANEDLVLAVRDTGIGVPPDRMDRLFRSFSQVDASTTRRFGGTGLGLAICKRLAELMSGEISVESAPGQGATFRVTLPLAKSGADLPASDMPWPRGRQVLVADANAASCRSVAERLGAWGLDVQIASSAEEIVGGMESGTAFDAIVMDAALARRADASMRRTELDTVPPVIVMRMPSRAGSDKTEHYGDALNVAAVIRKPPKTRQLREALATAWADEPRRAPPSRPAPSSSAAKASNLRILLVDDNAINRKVGKKILERLGYGPDIATSGAEAITKAKERNYDVILMDIEMPGMDGIEATAEIRAQGRAGGGPFFVALTANAMASDQASYLRSGMDAYLSKPIDVDALASTLAVAASVSGLGDGHT